MTEKRTCAWTGQEFEPTNKGGPPRQFINDRARAEAHKAARCFVEFLIRKNIISWNTIRHWWEHYKDNYK
jgi:hypothetical protein